MQNGMRSRVTSPPTVPVSPLRHSRCCYRPLPELREKVGPVLDADRVITYCGAGAAALAAASG